MPDELLSSAAPPVHASAGLHVVVSELAIAEEGCAGLEAAFRARLGAVDDFVGHRGLEVWRDNRRAGRYQMITWWDSPDAFHAYLRSDAHRASHARIPTDPVRPRGVGVSQFSLLST